MTFQDFQLPKSPFHRQIAQFQRSSSYQLQIALLIGLEFWCIGWVFDKGDNRG